MVFKSRGGGRDPRFRFFDWGERRLQNQLESRVLTLPKLRDQRRWASRFAPDLEFDIQCGAWRLLQRFASPLISQYASSAHDQGRKALDLTGETPPNFETFSFQVERNCDWKLIECTGEMSPADYFSLLSKKTFPCIRQLRPVEGVLCNDRPDFWHEAVGHISPLINSDVSKFYQNCGQLYGEVKQSGKKEHLKNLERLLWVTLEYGFLLEHDRWKAFGAAVSGSFVSLIKWTRGFWDIHDFDTQKIINAGLFDDDLAPKRDSLGRIIFFGMRDLQSTYEQIKNAVLSWT